MNTIDTESQELIIKESKIYHNLSEKVVDLTSYFLKRKVNTKMGTVYVNPTNEIEYQEVDELSPTPEAPVNTWKPIDFKVKKFASKLTISEDFLDDHDTDSGAVAQFEKDLVTGAVKLKNKKVIELLKTFPKKTLTGVDDLKTMLNVDVEEDYDTVLILTQSAYNELDLAKDSTGNYLLQPNISAKSGKGVGGEPIIVLPDKYLGKKGDKVGFYGADSSVITFDRSENYIKWADADTDAKFVKNSIRVDFQKLVTDQGFFLTLDFTKPEEEAPTTP